MSADGLEELGVPFQGNLDLAEQIRRAQVEEGENTVIKNLQKKDLIATPSEKPSFEDRIKQLVEEGKISQDAGLPEEEKLKVLKELGNRFNQGKLAWHLVDFQALIPMVKVLMYGAKKYAPNQWKNGLSKQETLDSLLRHLFPLLSGEEVDAESGELHIGHIFCNALFYSYFTTVDKTNARP